MSAGHAESEQKLSMELIEDTGKLAEVRDKIFIYKVLLPLIKNEVTIPVTLFDQIKQVVQEESQDTWQPNFDALSTIISDSAA